MKTNNYSTRNNEMSAERPMDTKNIGEALSVLAKSVLLPSENKRHETAPYPDFDGSQICAQVDPEIFFPEPAAPRMAEPRIVKQLCMTCPFRVECLNYALHHTVAGIWGGTSANERETIQKRLRITPVSMHETLEVG